jgi:ABC-2 type transport system permease protein
MKRRLFSVLACLAIGALFVIISVISSQWLAPLRYDTTKDKLYTISDATVAVLADLKTPIELDLYVSKAALVEDPVASAYGKRITDLLKTYVAHSGGWLSLSIHDAAPFTSQEEQARKNGLTPIPSANPDDAPAYMGLVLTSRLGPRQVLPLLGPDQETSLEYVLTRAITKLAANRPTRLGVITSLPWLYDRDPVTGIAKPVAQIARDLNQDMEVNVLDPQFSALSANYDVIVVAQPFALSPRQQFLLDQYALQGGALLVLLDPASLVSNDNGGGQIAATTALGALTRAWGFSVQGDVIADRLGALPVQTSINGRPIIAPQPLVFSVGPQGLSQTNTITRALGQGLHLATPGEVSFLDTPGIKFEPLITSSADTMRFEAARAVSGLSPQDVALDWESLGERTVLGAKVTGQLKTAFPNGDPSSSATRFLKESQKPARLVVVGDVDFLADSLYLTPDGTVADNGRFIFNALDALAGHEKLLDIGSRSQATRALVVVERVRKAAQARVLEEEEVLTTRLAQAESQLAELEAGSGQAAPDPSNGDIKRIRDEISDLRARLRQLQESVRKDVGGIKTAMIAVLGIILPLLVLTVGLCAFWWSNRRGVKVSAES